MDLWLNLSVRPHRKYQASRPGRFLPVVIYWLLISAGAALCLWIWRHTEASTGQYVSAHNSRPSQAADIAPLRISTPQRVSLVSTPTSSIAVPVSPAKPPALQPAATLPETNRVLEAQIELARQGISPGSLDGVFGAQTRAALRAFQERKHLPATGELDSDTSGQLRGSNSPFTNYLVTAADLARLHPLGSNWLSLSLQEQLDYETILELVAEKSRSHPNLIRRLNREVDWNHVAAGDSMTIPNVDQTVVCPKAAFLRISLSGKLLQAFDSTTNLLAHFPCSIARRVEKRPLGEMRVTVVVPHPNYTFDPDNFPESVDARELGRKLILPPGPNNPVGAAWIGLDKPGYGIHGTPRPEEVGRTESHGCFRLANWDAEWLVQMAWVGLPVYVEP